MSQTSSSDHSRSSLLARVNFPIYCIKAISERHILVGGGGGASKTGIFNTCEVYELVYDPHVNSARATIVTHFDAGKHAIMNFCMVPRSKYHFELATGGLQGICNVYQVKLKLKNGFEKNGQSTNSGDQSSLNNGGNFHQLRRRNFSVSHENDLEENVQNKNKQSENVSKHDDINEKRRLSIPKQEQTATIPEYLYQFELKKSFQTDFHEKEPYQKLIKYSPNAGMVFSAGADGFIRFWSFPKYSLLNEVKAHENEIDDIDVNPSGTHLVSVSRDGNSLVWNIYQKTTEDRSAKKSLTVLDHSSALLARTDLKKLSDTPNVKYVPRGCRFGITESDATDVKLFISLNPSILKTKLDSYICKWRVDGNETYRLEKIVNVENVFLTSMAISDDGRFLAVGKQTGDVDVYIAFSLQRCYHLPQAHNIFVTGIEFLPTNPVVMELVGGNTDSALISISVDNRIILHKIPKRRTLGFFGSFVFFFIFILIIYITMSYFDL